jgi:hypothetical protein
MHFITGKHLSRRTFLRGAGATVALPALDAMIPAGRVWRDAAADPSSTRLICIEEVMGTAGSSEFGLEQGLFVPETMGRNFELGPMNQLQTLEDLREYLTVVTNTDCRMADAWVPEELGGGHGRTAAVVFTQAHPKRTAGSDIFVGRSLDQLHAQRYGQEMPLPSLQLDIEPASGGGGNGYHPVYGNRISWASPTEPLPAIRSPRIAFERIFGRGNSPEDRSDRREARRSILDWVAGEVARLRTELGAVDRVAMEKYLSDVRELERRIELVEARSSSGEERALPEAPAAVPDSWMEHMEIMFDLQVLALESDMTRVISFKTGRSGSNRIFPGSGVLKAFHATSHHSNDPDTIYDYHQISTYRLSAMRYLLEKLRDTTEAGVPLLDKTAIIWGSGMGDPNLHSTRRCPLIMMGRANGALEGNVHLKALEGTPMANAFVSLLRGIGHDDLQLFGDSTGPLPLTPPGHTGRPTEIISRTG